MWQSNSLEGFLAGMDSLERRRTYCTGDLADPGSGPRYPTLSLVRSASDDAVVTDRRGALRRPERRSAKSQAPADLASAAGALLDQLDLAVVILDRGGYVRLANAAARRTA